MHTHSRPCFTTIYVNTCILLLVPCIVLYRRSPLPPVLSTPVAVVARAIRPHRCDALVVPARPARGHHGAVALVHLQVVDPPLRLRTHAQRNETNGISCAARCRHRCASDTRPARRYYTRIAADIATFTVIRRTLRPRLQTKRITFAPDNHGGVCTAHIIFSEVSRNAHP